MRELKSTASDNSWGKQRKGQLAEKLIAAQLCNEGWHLLSQRFQTPFAELDLLFINKELNVLKIVEVKFQHSFSFALPLIKNAQKLRISNAMRWLAAETHLDVEAELACVDAQAGLEWVEDFLC